MSQHDVWTLEPVIDLDDTSKPAEDMDTACLRLKQALARSAVLPSAQQMQYPRSWRRTSTGNHHRN